MKKKAIIFGAGEYGKLYLGTAPADLEILGFVDNDPRKHGTEIMGLPVYGPDSILSSGAEIVCVASSFMDEIVEQLTQRMGLPENMIRVVGIDDTKSALDPADQDALRGELKRLAQALDRAGVPWWLDHSTLLNLERSGEFMNGYDDIDLCILDADAAQATKVIESLFDPSVIHAMPFQEHMICPYWKVEDLARIKIGKGIDIQFKYRYQDGVYWHVGPFALEAPLTFYKGRETRVYSGIDLHLPKDAHRYLTHLYGAWEKPQPGWTYAHYNNIIERFSSFS